MRLIGIILLLFFLLLTGSCSNNVSKKHTNGSICQHELLHIPMEELFLYNPQLAVSDSLLILLSHREEKGVCHIYSLASDTVKKLCNYGKIGSGPGEFLQPVLTFAEGNIFGINDINLTQLSLMEVEQTEKTAVVREQKRMKAARQRSKDGFIPKDTRFMKCGNAHYVSFHGVGDGELFTLSDTLLKPITCFGELPIEGELHAMSVRNRLQGRMKTQGNYFFFATSNLPYLAAYQVNNETVEKRWSLFFREPHYQVSNGDLKYNREKSVGPVLDIDADGKYIYLLFMNQLLSEYDFNKNDKSCSDKVLVFDYQGNEVAELNLDCRLQRFAVNRMKIYGIAQNPNTTLVRFDLPKELSASESSLP